ncbi:MAG: tetratricopeptide repeat protein [Desulfobacteraceae bacterium]|nr:tetratricopeptide repeat protein [Desulfobacteraceae bacterium]
MTKEEYKNQISGAWKKYEEKDFESAKELCLQIKTEYPDQLEANYLLGKISFDEKAFEDSIGVLKQALRKDGEKKAGGFINYWIGRNYGEETFSLENPIYNKDLSRVSYEKALEYENYPEDVIIQLNYIYQNNYKLIDLYKRATKKFPENLNFYLTLSTVYQ